MRTELFVILLRIHRDVLTDLCLHLLQQARLLTILQPIVSNQSIMVGCVAQLAGEPTLSCARPAADR